MIAQRYKFSIEKKNIHSDNELTNKKVNFMHNILLIAQWVQNFDTKKVNDCFDNFSNKVPLSFRSYEKQISNDLAIVGKMKLSPNKQHLNEFMVN